MRIADDRPLTWGTLTVPSKLMLPMYVAGAAYIGACYILSPPERLQGASLTVARQVLSMDAWGALAWTLSVVLAVSFLTRRRQLAAAALCVGALAYLVWTGFYAAAIFADPTASLVSPVWPTVTAVAHVATALSLITREVPR